MKKTLLVYRLPCPRWRWPMWQLYGTIRSGVSVSQTKIGNERFTTTSVDDLGSHIGLRGSHPIGGSNQVTWQFSEDVPVGQADTSMRGYFRNKKNSSTPISMIDVFLIYRQKAV